MIYKIWIALNLILFIYLIFNDLKRSENLFCSVVGSAFFSALSAFCTFIIVVLPIMGIVDLFSDKTEYIAYETPIVCLNDSTSIEGHKYLFSGCINEKMIYRTMYIDSHGGKKMWELNVNDCSVFEDNQNKVVAYKYEYTNPTVIKWIGSYGEIFKEDNISRYEIHIPQGSITTEYNIDLN